MDVAGEDLHTGLLMGVTHDRVTACSLHSISPCITYASTLTLKVSDPDTASAIPSAKDVG